MSEDEESGDGDVVEFQDKKRFVSKSQTDAGGSDDGDGEESGQSEASSLESEGEKSNSNEDSEDDMSSDENRVSKRDSFPLSDDEDDEYASDEKRDQRQNNQDTKKKTKKNKKKLTKVSRISSGNKVRKSIYAFPCNDCDKGYHSKRDLRSHIHRKHNPLTSKVLFERDYKKNDYRQKCEKCKKIFNDPVVFRTHFECHPPPQRLPSLHTNGKPRVKCPFKGCKIKPGIGWAAEHLCKTHYKETDFHYRCCHCQKTFWEEEMAILHVANYHLLEEYVCNARECHKTFSTGIRLSQHKTISHDPSFRSQEDKSWEGVHYIKHKFKKRCRDCQRVFTHPPIFRTHEPCFSRTENLLTDPESVASGLIYECHFCEMRFTRIYNLAIHVSQVHVKGKDFRYQCKYCDKRMIDRRTVTEHLGRKHGISSHNDVPLKTRTASGDDNRGKKPGKQINLSSTPVPLKSIPLIVRPRAHSEMKTVGLKKEEGKPSPMQVPEEIFKINLVPKNFKIKKLSPATSTVTSKTWLQRFSQDETTSQVSLQKQFEQLCAQSVKKVSQNLTTNGEPKLPTSPSVIITNPFSDESFPVTTKTSSSFSEKLADPQPNRKTYVPSTQSNPTVNELQVSSFNQNLQETVNWDQMVLERTSVTVQVSSPAAQASTVTLSQRQHQPSSTDASGDHSIMSQGDVDKRPVIDEWVMTRISDTRESLSPDCSFIKKLSFLKECQRCQIIFNNHLEYLVHDPCYGLYPATFGAKTTEYLLRCTLNDCKFQTRFLEVLQEHMVGHLKYKAYYCSVCDDKFYSRADGEQHYRDKHIFESPSTITSTSATKSSYPDVDKHFKVKEFSRNCPDCRRLFKNHLEFLVHDPCYGMSYYCRGKRTTDKLLHCTETGCIFQTKSLVILQEHTNLEHFGFVPFYCLYCPGKSYMTRPDCQSHYDRCHSTKPRTGSSNSTSEQHSIEEDSKEGEQPSIDVSTSDLYVKKEQTERKSRESRSPERRKRSPSHYRRSRSREHGKRRRISRSPSSSDDSYRRYRSRSPKRRRRSSSRLERSSFNRDNEEKTSFNRDNEEKTSSYQTVVCCIELPKKNPCIFCNERHSFPTSNRTHYPCFLTSPNYIYDKESGNRKFKCGICQKDFNALEDLGRHESVDHFWIEDVAYQCSVCFKKFFTSKGVIAHIIADHRGLNSKKDIEIMSLEEYAMRQLKLKNGK